MPPSKIIKGGEREVVSRSAPERVLSPVSNARPVVNSEIYDAHLKAKAIVEQANNEASEIIAQAELQAQHMIESAAHEAEEMVKQAAQQQEEVLAEARENGYQEGIAQATSIILHAKQEATRIEADSESEMVKLALAIGEKLIGHVLEIDPEKVLSIAARVIENVRQQRELVLRLNPEDAKVVRVRRKNLMDLLGRTKEIAVREDNEICRGDCIVETENGSIDARLETQLKMLEEALLKKVKVSKADDDYRD